jgi:hypothetical protein
LSSLQEAGHEETSAGARGAARAPEDAGLDEADGAQNNVLLGVRAQGGNARHDLVLHNAVFQPKIVGLDEIA